MLHKKPNIRSPSLLIDIDPYFFKSLTNVVGLLSLEEYVDVMTMPVLPLKSILEFEGCYLMKG